MPRADIIPGDVTLFFIAGAPKAGTTTIWNMLRNHPDCHFRAIKELHYFDSHCLGLPDARASLRQDVKRLQNERYGAQEWPDADVLTDRVEWLETDGSVRCDETYLRYLMKGRTTERLVGEATPAYSVLPEENLRELASLGETVKILFIMRDPIGRLWSHIRMSAARAAQNVAMIGTEARRIAERVLAGRAPHHARLCDYAGTVERIRTVFKPQNVLICFFETLFTSDSLAKLTVFLGIRPFESNCKAEVSNRGVSLPMPEDLRHDLAAYLRPQYAFVKRAFGTAVPTEWTCPEVRAA